MSPQIAIDAVIDINARIVTIAARAKPWLMAIVGPQRVHLSVRFIFRTPSASVRTREASRCKLNQIRVHAEWIRIRTFRSGREWLEGEAPKRRLNPDALDKHAWEVDAKQV